MDSFIVLFNTKIKPEEYFVVHPEYSDILVPISIHKSVLSLDNSNRYTYIGGGGWSRTLSWANKSTIPNDEYKKLYCKPVEGLSKVRHVYIDRDIKVNVSDEELQAMLHKYETTSPRARN